MCSAPSREFLLLKAPPVLKTQMPVLSCFLSLNAVSLRTEICFDRDDILSDMMLPDVREQETQPVWVPVWLSSQHYVNILAITGVRREVLS